MARMEDIAAAISIFAIFSPFRVFSQSHHIAKMIIYREKLRKTQTYAKILSHTESTETTEIISFEHGWDGLYGWMILRLQYLFCDFRDFCVTLYLDIAAQYRFSQFFAYSRVFAIPSHRGNDSLSRKTAENTELRENLSHTENTESTEIISFEHGWDGLYGWRILRRNIFSVISVISV